MLGDFWECHKLEVGESHKKQNTGQVLTTKNYGDFCVNSVTFEKWFYGKGVFYLKTSAKFTELILTRPTCVTCSFLDQSPEPKYSIQFIGHLWAIC